MLGRTVAELDEGMSSAEYSEWMALLRVEPWGQYRADFQAAIGAWASAAPWSSQVKVSDFVPEYGDRTATPTDPAKIRAFFRALSGGKPDGQPEPG